MAAACAGVMLLHPFAMQLTSWRSSFSPFCQLATMAMIEGTMNQPDRWAASPQRPRASQSLIPGSSLRRPCAGGAQTIK